MVSMVMVYMYKESHGHKVAIVQFSQKFKCLIKVLGRRSCNLSGI